MLGKDPCGYFQWLHGPLWCPREKVQPSLRRWVQDTTRESLPVPLLKGKGHEMEGFLPWEMHYVKKPSSRPWPDGYVPDPLLKKHCLDGPGTRGPTGWTDRQWLNQFADSAAAQQRELERRSHFHSKFGSGTLF